MTGRLTAEEARETETKKQNEYLKLILDATPLGCILWNIDFKIIGCNETAVQLFGFKSKSELMEKFSHSSWPKYQPDEKVSHDASFMLLRKAFKEGSLVIEWRHQKNDGTSIPMKTTFKRLGYGGEDILAVYTSDLREHKQMLGEIEQQNNLMLTVSHMAEIILESHIESFRNDLLHSMRIMAQATDADRIYIWKNFMKNGKLHCYQIYELSEGAESQSDYALAVETLYSDIVPGWEEKLSKGECINGIVREMSDYEKAALCPQGILSILLVPIFIKKQFWGFVGLDDCHSERIFSDKEEMVLRSSSRIIANALVRNEETEKAREADNRAKLMLDTMPFGCLIIDSNNVTIDCNEAVVKLFGYADKQKFLSQWFNECFPEFQPDGQRSDSKILICRDNAIEKGSCEFEWMYQTPDGASLPAEVSLIRVGHEEDFLFLKYIRDLREIKKMEENVRNLKMEVGKIYLDPLIGIYNRRFLDENLKRCINALSRSNSILSFMMIDIDYFKRYNDIYGHQAGDKCLILIAETLIKSLGRVDDFVARYGGEEFAVVLPNTDELGACLVADMLLKNIRNLNMLHENSDAANHVTISIGVTTGKAKHTQSGSEYIERADEMLYKSKRNGRNRYSFGELFQEIAD